jgi:hypothetical protein
MTADVDKERKFASAIGAGGGVYRQMMARVELCRLQIDPVRVRLLRAVADRCRRTTNYPVDGRGPVVGLAARDRSSKKAANA